MASCTIPCDLFQAHLPVVQIAVTRAFPRPRGLLISEWNSKEDLVQTLLTSCHIPV